MGQGARTAFLVRWPLGAEASEGATVWVLESECQRVDERGRVLSSCRATVLGAVMVKAGEGQSRNEWRSIGSPRVFGVQIWGGEGSL